MCQRPKSKPITRIHTISHEKYTDKHTQIYYSSKRMTYSEARKECDKIGATMVNDEETLKDIHHL